MTAKELVGELDKREYGDNFGNVVQDAEESGLLIISGASDDLMEFDGAFCDEAGVYDGGTVYITKNGLSESETENKIDAIWYQDGIDWQYNTNIPHETFDLMEHGSLYCRGLVIDTKDLK